MSFEITDTGDFVDRIYHTQEASSFYGILIGRKQPLTNTKADFCEEDIIKKGYLKKQGSWRKSWKKRFFILRSDIRELCYYPSAEQLTLIGSVAIDENTIIWNLSDTDTGVSANTAFAIRWHAPEGSGRSNREVMLKANDAGEMKEWLNAISSEAVRTEERRVIDWWTDLFGSARSVDTKSMRETIRQRASSIRMRATTIHQRSSQQLTQPQGIDEVEEEENDMEEEAQQGAGDWEKEDCIAESQAETAVRTVEHWKSFSKRRGREQSGFFGDDRDSGSEAETEGSRRGSDKKLSIVHKLLRSQSSGRMDPCRDTVSPACVQAEGINQEMVGEPDNEEEFVFERVEDEDTTGGCVQDDQSDAASEVSKSSFYSTMENTPVTVLEKSVSYVVDSSEPTLISAERRDSDSTLSIHDKKKLTAEERYAAAVRGGGSSTPRLKKKKKEKKEKPAGPPPFVHPTVAHHEVNDALCGVSISVELSHLIEEKDKIFCVVFVGSIKFSSMGVGGISPDRYDSVDWKQISRTEACKVDKGTDSGGHTLSRVVRRFYMAQEPIMTEDYTHIMIVLYKSNTRQGRRENDNNTDLTQQIAVCRSIMRKDFFLTSSRGVVKVDMKILSETLNSSGSPPSAKLGLLLLSSFEMAQRRNSLTSNFKTQPYGEALYCFNAMHSQSFVLEQLYASRYSVTVASAFLELLIQERTIALDKTKKVVKRDLAATVDALKKIPSKTALQELDDMLTGGGSMEWGTGSNTIDTVSRAEALQKTKSALKDIEEAMIENYKDCYEHCGRILAGQPLPGSVIPEDVGGTFLRRSVWKKSPVWQFCATNLNTNVMTWGTVSNKDLTDLSTIDSVNPHSPFASDGSALPQISARGNHKSSSKSRDNNHTGEEENSLPTPEGIDTAFHITFGCPCAHAMGFHDGGLRRVMQGLGNSERKRLFWMSVLQSTGGIAIDTFVDQVKNNLSQAQKLFDCTIDTYSADGLTALFNKAFKMAMRIDSCCSQVLCFATTLIKTIIFMAAQGVTHQIDVLTSSLALNNFLVSVQSLLSTQGHEMGMIEDMDTAVLWLSTVTIRLVRSVQQEKFRSSEAQTERRQRKRSRRVTSRYTLSPAGVEVMAGMCEDICITRDETTKGIILDLELNSDEISVVERCLETARGWTQGSSTENTHVAGESSTIDVEGVVLNTDTNDYNNSKISAPEAQKSKVIAEFGLTGVLFTQGVNEMQTLANVSGGEAAKQVEINLASFNRLSDYVAKKRAIFQTQIDRKTKNLATFYSHAPSFDMMSNPDPSPSIKQDQRSIDGVTERLLELDRAMCELDKTLLQSSRNVSEKYVGVLMKSAVVSRLVGGSLGILCKSGKDRTSMAVTLEQARILTDSANIMNGNEVCRVMRKHGVRRMNVYANTGQSCFAFNNFQQQLLPKCYRPPGGTFTGNVAT